MNSAADVMSFRSIVDHAVSVGLAMPIPWCSEHSAPMRDETECVIVIRGYEWRFEPCQLESMTVYRIGEATDE